MNYKELLINKDKVVMTSVDLAIIIGDLEEAIVLNQVSYWLEKYREISHNFKDKRYWVYNSYQKWHDDNFPFWSPKKIQRIFRSLEKKGLLLSANYNSVGFDKTKWYSINYNKLQAMINNYENQNKQSLLTDEQSLLAGEQSLLAGEQSLLAGEQSLLAGEQPIPEDTTEDTTKDTTKGTTEGTNRGNRVDYQEIINLYNNTCVSFPKVFTLSETRKKAIKKKLKTYSMEDFKKLFEMTEGSKFLKGENNWNWSANFDWLIKDSNMVKVLEGNYEDKLDNRPRQTSTGNIFLDMLQEEEEKERNEQNRNN